MIKNASRREVIALTATIFLILLSLAFYAPNAVRKSHKADFERYYYAGCVAMHGGDIYEKHDDLQFKYFPFFAEAMVPIAWISESACPSENPDKPFANEKALLFGAGLWFAVLSFSYLGSLLLAVSLCKPENISKALWIFWIALAFSARFFVANLKNGQINMPVMFLALFGCWLVIKGRECFGGISIGLAAATKFMPVVLLLWLFRKKKWWGGVYLASTVLACLFIFPSLIWGVEGNYDMLEKYIGQRKKMVTDLPEEQAAGQSIPSLTNRLLCKVNSAPLRLRDEDGNREPIYVNILNLEESTAKYIALAFVLILSAAAWRSLSPSYPGSSARRVVEVGLIFVLMLLISPEARKAHYITLLIPVAGLAAVYLEGGAKRGWSLLGLSFVLSNITSRGIVGDNAAYYYLNAYCVVMWGAVILYMLLTSALHQPLPEKAEIETEPDDIASDSLLDEPEAEEA
ncbi:MAG: DUF2029 domain-containing protein [Planctomycetes bacterium]|nr:DUF2029 domain-containing protein [Planctomycetota bacterium]